MKNSNIINPTFASKTHQMNCYCCSGKPFEDCCHTFISGQAKPATAEALMRSRYSAYATLAIPYLLETTHVSTRKYYNAQDMLQWAQTCTWQKLEIIGKKMGSASDTQGKVEFKAYYLDQQQLMQVHHEHSTFKKENGNWYFVDGKVM